MAAATGNGSVLAAVAKGNHFLLALRSEVSLRRVQVHGAICVRRWVLANCDHK
jgi:hypothetical protein